MTNTTTLKSWGELPEDIRILLVSDSTIEKIEAIGLTHGLSIMKQGFLVRICANLMKGIVEPKVFVTLLESELDIPRASAALIAQDINREIFSGVKESLKKLHVTSGLTPQALPTNTVPANSPVPSVGAPKSAFEQKIGGTFQMSTPDAPQPVKPKFVMPNFAQSVSPVTPHQIAPPQKPAVDPYHESPV